MRKDQWDADGALADYNRLSDGDLTALIKRRPEMANIYLSRGKLRKSHGDAAGALADFSRLIEYRPSSGEAYYDRGTVEADNGDGTAAIADFTAALPTMGANAPQALYARGKCYAQQGAFDRAIVDFGQAVKLNPGMTEVYRPLALAEMMTGDFKAAAADFARDVQIRPEDAVDGRLYQVICLRRLEADEAPAGLPAAAKDLSIDWQKQAYAYFLGELKEADYLAWVAQAGGPELRERQCDADYYAGEMRLIRQDVAGAREFFQKCVELGVVQTAAQSLARSELARLP